MLCALKCFDCFVFRHFISHFSDEILTSEAYPDQSTLILDIFFTVGICMLISNYWMRLSMISRIIQTEVNVICRSEAEADNIDRGLNNS